MKGEYKMSYQEIAKDIIDKLPADKMIYVINILENLGEMYGVSLYPNYEPNKETVEAIEEVDKRQCKINVGIEDIQSSMPTFFDNRIIFAIR